MYYIDPNQGSPADALLAYCSFSSTSKQTCLHPRDSQVWRHHQRGAAGNCSSGSMTNLLFSLSCVVWPESQSDKFSVRSHFHSVDLDICRDDLNLNFAVLLWKKSFKRDSIQQFKLCACLPVGARGAMPGWMRHYIHSEGIRIIILIIIILFCTAVCMKTHTFTSHLSYSKTVNTTKHWLAHPKNNKNWSWGVWSGCIYCRGSQFTSGSCLSCMLIQSPSAAVWTSLTFTGLL